jgi:hypothetical protein
MRTGEFYVYAYLRKDGTPYYVGKGKEDRAFSSQGRCVSTPKDLNQILFLKKNLSERKAFEFEKYMIFVLGRKDKGTGILRNLTDGGEGPSGYTHTEETRRRLSKLRTGKVLSEETRRKVSDSLKGRPVSENTIRASVEAKKGKPLTDEHRKKISEGRRGIPAHNKGKTGGTLSEETRRRMAEARRGHPSYTAGLKWFVNDSGETALTLRAPGPEWQRGRKWK